MLPKKYLPELFKRGYNYFEGKIKEAKN